MPRGNLRVSGVLEVSGLQRTSDCKLHEGMGLVLSHSMLHVLPLAAFATEYALNKYISMEECMTGAPWK